MNSRVEILETAGQEVPIVSLATAKSLLGVTGTAKDSLVGRLCKWSTSAIYAHCHRNLFLSHVRESRPGSGSSEMSLSLWPLAGIPESVVYRDDTLDDWIVLDPKVPLLYRQVGWFRSMVFQGTLEPTERPDSDILDTVVTYSAGYRLPDLADDDVPAWATASVPLPDYVERAALVTIDSWLRLSSRDPEVSQRTVAASDDKLGQVTVSYRATPANYQLPDGAKDLLRPEVR